MKFFSFLTFLICLSANAVTLSLEALLRHAANGEVAGNTVSINFSIKKLSEENAPTNYLRVFMAKEGNIWRFSQMLFEGPDFTNNQLANIKTTQNLVDDFGKDTAKDLFITVVGNILFNDSSLFLEFFRKNDVEVKAQNQTPSKEKIKLLEAYKAYLKSPTTKENPLNPTNIEDKRKVTQLLQSNLYVSTHPAQILRQNNINLIKFSAANFTALFNNDDHRLMEASHQHKGDCSIHLENYITLNGANYFPQFITIKTTDQAYRLQTISYKYVNESQADFDKRDLSLNQLLKNNKKNSTLQVPTFLY